MNRLTNFTFFLPFTCFFFFGFILFLLRLCIIHAVYNTKKKKKEKTKVGKRKEKKRKTFTCLTGNVIFSNTQHYASAASVEVLCTSRLLPICYASIAYSGLVCPQNLLFITLACKLTVQL